MKIIALIVLTSGEHLIGQIEDGEMVGATEVMVEQPVSIMPDPNKQGSILFIEYFQFSEETRDMFQMKDIRHVLTPKSSLMNAYSEKYSVIAKPDGFKLV